MKRLELYIIYSEGKNIVCYNLEWEELEKPPERSCYEDVFDFESDYSDWLELYRDL